MEENKTQPNVNDKNIKVLRTYTSDMADAIRTNEVSVIKIALAEKEKREQENIYKEAEGSNLSKIFLVVGGIIFIAVAIFGSYYLIQKKKENDIPKQTVANIETFISYDSKLYIDTTNIKDASSLINLIKEDKQTNQGLIKAILPTKIENNIPVLLITNDFLSLLKTNAPGALTRSLSDKYLLGKYLNQSALNVQDKSAMFLILETTNYNQAYASMLDWEKTILKDLYVIFGINIPEQNSPLFDKQWKDIIIDNKDARVLYGDNGEGVLYYSFINKNNFVITSSIEAMKEILSRLIVKNAQPF